MAKDGLTKKKAATPVAERSTPKTTWKTNPRRTLMTIFILLVMIFTGGVYADYLIRRTRGY